MIQRFTISRDDHWYQAWPDVALTPKGRLVCVFSQCIHHGDRSHTEIMYMLSDDRGRTWRPKRPLTEALDGDPKKGDPYWNCARVMSLSGGRMAIVVDKAEEGSESGHSTNWLWFSKDQGESWDGPHPTPVLGIVPDKLIELKHGEHTGRWLLSAHCTEVPKGASMFRQRCWHSDDQGRTWSGPHMVAASPELLLCEASILEMPQGELVAFLREQSHQGLDRHKCISHDGGVTWEGPYRFPLPGCHRPVAGFLQSGKVMITYRMTQGGEGWLGWWTQNFMAGLTDAASCLALDRKKMHTRILPIDFDRSPRSDLGYSGWVQFPDGEIYIVNYIVDDAPLAQIRGYALTERDFVLEE